MSAPAASLAPTPRSDQGTSVSHPRRKSPGHPTERCCQPGSHSGRLTPPTSPDSALGVLGGRRGQTQCSEGCISATQLPALLNDDRESRRHRIASPYTRHVETPAPPARASRCPHYSSHPPMLVVSLLTRFIASRAVAFVRSLL